MNDAWYALQVRHRFEKTTEFHLGEKGYEVFLPTYVRKSSWSDRTKNITQPLFPGYVFCRFDIGNRLPILVIPGVYSIVGIAKAPAPVDPEEIAALRRVVASGVPALACDYISAGDTVRVERGPLEGLVGIVLRTKSGDRLILSMTLLMRSVSVEIDRSWVTAIGKPNPIHNPSWPSVRERQGLALASDR